MLKKKKKGKRRKNLWNYLKLRTNSYALGKITVIFSLFYNLANLNKESITLILGYTSQSIVLNIIHYFIKYIL